MPKNSAKSKAADKTEQQAEPSDIHQRQMEALDRANARHREKKEKAKAEIARQQQEFRQLPLDEQYARNLRILQLTKEDREAFARERADFKTEYAEEKAARLAKASQSNVLQFYKRDNNEDPVNRLRPDNEMLWPWRELDRRKQPKPSLWNARTAIEVAGISCSYNSFHNKLLFGFKGDLNLHEMSFLVGDVTDNGIMALRQILSARFGVDFGTQNIRDAVISLALENCFDPVADMLDQAQGNWDGIKRLDRFAVDYLNAEDTPLNRAIGRKTLLAAVRRVRKPGCKFDIIIVLEGPEGWNKSSAWRMLAVSDDNFSDASILGKGAREVQEHLSEVWLHENSELAGMTNADIEVVKAFASRQSDDARPAYGHFLKKQKRHSIEVGSTNSDVYLRAQTGNRRFWPLQVLKPIDIELLKKDLMQLWGEAATYEAAGESLVIDKELWPAAAEAQEKRRVADVWEDKLTNMPTHWNTGMYDKIQLHHFSEAEWQKIVKEHEHHTYKAEALYTLLIHQDGDREVIATKDVLEIVLGIPAGQQTVAHGIRLANAMRQAGWERPASGRVTIDKKQVRGYFRSRRS
jgi:predicted P-loop ATPase